MNINRYGYEKVAISQQKCPRCSKSKIILADNNETCCSSCGYVLSDQAIETGPEWRSYKDNASNNARAGAPTTLAVHDQGLSTVIGTEFKDATGKPLSANMRYLMQRLKKWDGRSKGGSVDRNLKAAFSELARLGDKLTLNTATVEKAAWIYRKALESKLIRGRSIKAIIAASVYAACRLLGVTRNLKDMEATSNIKRKDIARCYRMIFQHLDIKAVVLDPIQCIGKIGSKLDVKEKSIREAVKVLKAAHAKDEVAGKDPMGLAAAALYLGCIKNGDNITQRKIAMAAGVTEVTIRNRFKGLKDLNLVEASTIKLIEKRQNR